MCQEIENRMIKYLVFVLIILAAFVASGRCAVSKKPNGNSLGVVQYQDNPFVYVEGKPISVEFVGGNEAVSLGILPRGTYSLFRQEVLFCDPKNVISLFQGKHGVVTMTYERISHRLVEGLGCHELLYVDEVSAQ